MSNEKPSDDSDHSRNAAAAYAKCWIFQREVIFSPSFVACAHATIRPSTWIQALKTVQSGHFQVIDYLCQALWESKKI